jgi:hypothetical protein
MVDVPFGFVRRPDGDGVAGVDERMEGHMTGVGFDDRQGRCGLVGCWPYREEPCLRDSSAPNHTSPHIEFATLPAGKSVTLTFRLYEGSAEPYAFTPVLRRNFSETEAAHKLNPWFSFKEAADHAAHGIYTWHYDEEFHALWETCTYDLSYAKNNKFVDRFEMHTGFVSGSRMRMHCVSMD